MLFWRPVASKLLSSCSVLLLLHTIAGVGKGTGRHAILAAALITHSTGESSQGQGSTGASRAVIGQFEEASAAQMPLSANRGAANGPDLHSDVALPTSLGRYRSGTKCVPLCFFSRSGFRGPDVLSGWSVVSRALLCSALSATART